VNLDEAGTRWTTRRRWGVASLAFQLCTTETFAVVDYCLCLVESLAAKSLTGNAGYQLDLSLSGGVTINHTRPHRATPDRTGPEMTDYFPLTTATSRIKA